MTRRKAIGQKPREGQSGGRGKLGKGREDVHCQVPINKIRTPKLRENDRKRGRGQEKAPEEVLPESPAGGPTTTSVHSQGARSSHFGGWPVLAPVDLAELLLSLEGLKEGRLGRIYQLRMPLGESDLHLIRVACGRSGKT